MIPSFLLKKLECEYGSELTNQIVVGYSKRRPTTFRVNHLKTSKDKIINELKDNNIKYEDFFEKSDAFIINDDISRLKELSIYKNGEIYVQSLSSMIPAVALEAKEGEDILDMTAAPGGKTTQIADVTNNKANITACEMNKIRSERLKYNVEKQGANSVLVMNTDARRIDNLFSFDKILLDAPCSGSGTLNSEDKNVEKYFTEELIKKSIKSQTELLDKALKILKIDHYMIYSTCSILKEENEEVVNKVLSKNNAEIVPIKIEELFNEEEINKISLLPTSIEGTICLYPNELFEGFFVAKIRKK